MAQFHETRNSGELGDQLGEFEAKLDFFFYCTSQDKRFMRTTLEN